MNKTKITYGRTAYVETTNEMLDLIGININDWSEGDGNKCVSLETLTDFLKESKESPLDTDNFPPKLVEFIQAVVDSIEGEVGDIIFHN